MGDEHDLVVRRSVTFRLDVVRRSVVTFGIAAFRVVALDVLVSSEGGDERFVGCLGRRLRFVRVFRRVVTAIVSRRLVGVHSAIVGRRVLVVGRRRIPTAARWIDRLVAETARRRGDGDATASEYMSAWDHTRPFVSPNLNPREPSLGQKSLPGGRVRSRTAPDRREKRSAGERTPRASSALWSGVVTVRLRPPARTVAVQSRA
ncbi:hypothetical protein D8S78_02210 [Natrialba swarupiae]|nr:hypothetical protein [Natrialba swarupiae]